jgi:peptidoglycan/LPS O-acetylase OafA/YrhL
MLVVIDAIDQETPAASKSRTVLARFTQVPGAASCALYLSHLLTIALLRAAWSRLEMGTEGILCVLAFVAVAVLASVAAGLLGRLLIAQPIPRLVQRLLPIHQPALEKPTVAIFVGHPARLSASFIFAGNFLQSAK